ncbi:hypothetical protein GCM10022254_50070 [Actinomadura meridiana]|uniref:Right handed beta helix domain-containing protein n=1 Tax=Actinomadura meridiana TaxID=559626 RepID=A0ABP8CCJ0_9ACTN
MRRTISASLGTVVALAGLAAFAPSSQAAPTGRTHVVWPGHSIQAAVNRARPGDTIRLKKGHYYGDVLVRKRLTIRGEGNDTVIRPGHRAHCADGLGICVIGQANRPVKDVTIRNLSVQDFSGTGVYGIYTDRLQVLAVVAKNNGEYGIAEYRSTRGRFQWNWTLDNADDAGLYVGDIANARGTEVADNHSSGNTLGVLVRHAHHVMVHNNEVTGNCTGIALVDDGQKGGQGHNKVWKNKVLKNNRHCAAHEQVPALHGTGILLFGGERNEIVKNTVRDNRGKLPYSGGIVLFPGVSPGGPARHNLIKSNIACDNARYDLLDKSGSRTNRFRHNTCETSKPKKLCHG